VQRFRERPQWRNQLPKVQALHALRQLGQLMHPLAEYPLPFGFERGFI
jgi:hypothetical protein